MFIVRFNAHVFRDVIFAISFIKDYLRTWFYGRIGLNLEVCISNSHVYKTVILAVNVTVTSGASYLHDNHLGLIVRRNQRPNDFPIGHL
jgi:hypothetical protein